MTRQKDEALLDRRHFLRTVGGASTVAAAAAASPLAATTAEAFDPGADETKGLYRVTPDVEAFYRTNRY